MEGLYDSFEHLPPVVQDLLKRKDVELPLSIGDDLILYVRHDLAGMPYEIIKRP